MTGFVSDAFRLELRDNLGGGAARALRRTSMTPGVIYGAGKDNTHISVDPRDIMTGLNTVGFYARLYELSVGKTKERVIVREVQMHPVTDRPLHIDFVRVSKGEKIHVNIPVHFINEDQCPAIKQGGMLNIVLHSLEVTSAIESIPEEIVIDLAGLEMGDSIHTEGLKITGGAVISHPERDITIATLVAPSSVKSEGVDEEAETDEAAPDDAEADKADEK
ncbi:MAG TPA: 50S ribosomal protein L25 [Holosporales bacterium]|nr:50S ribosomal protein L25 [Holosporales bacterium]